MTCQECERYLAGGIEDAGVEPHLEMCEDCRWMAGELRANAEALRALRDEAPAALVSNPRPRWVWAAAAAAVVVVAFGIAWMGSAKRDVVAERGKQPLPVIAAAPAPEPPVIEAPLPAPRVAKPKLHQTLSSAPTPEEPLLVRMETSDPDVVIYWLIEPNTAPKEGVL